MPRSLPLTWALRAAALLAVAVTATACAKSVDPSARSDRQAWDAMYPAVLDAVQAVDPGIEPKESGGGHTACHPTDFIGDSMDESEVIGSASITLHASPSDQRSPAELAREVVTGMERKGWEGPGLDGISAVNGQVSVSLKMPGSGAATVSASHERPTEAPAFNRLTVSLSTECLRNSDWHG
ncbi:hypothetical protein F4556_000434 [Kitasatospora gansuensis]|uniref:Lipoprotein n=1 Tax=Kitasatospora gansuensis TaxID=258050 RepID=A0A7W7S6N9_9ACTN|nr:hypothetical protein [Kitasatospora gansuensis]MBB4944899.1 hypothetical protein [Kitasatospora gansuensis]